MSELYAQLAEQHGHYCPMSTLGLRLGQQALRVASALNATNWQFCYYARTCAVDGISLALKRAGLPVDFSVDQQGQHLLLCRSADGKELSLALSPEAMQLAKAYHEFDEDGKQQQLELLRTIAVERLIDISGTTTDV